MRRLVLLTSAVVFIDVVFFTAITPMLPYYVEELGLGKTEVAILQGGYAAGTLLASLPAGAIATRYGPRRVLVWGLLLLGLSSFAFGLSTGPALLAGARVVQGVAGAITWAGALTWLTTAAGERRRGAVIGDTFAAAIAGSLLGPAVGALAVEVGATAVFSSVLVVTAALAWITVLTPEARRPRRVSLRETPSALLSRPIARAAVYVVTPSVMFGVIGVVVPLRIDELGGSAGLIALGFAGGAAIEAVLTPFVGRFSDRAGRFRPIATGLAACAVVLVAVPVVTQLTVLLSLVVAVSVGAGFCFTPAIALLADAADRVQLPQGMAAGVINVAWAGGQMFGAVAGGTAAGEWGDLAPCLALAAVLATAAAAAARIEWSRRSGDCRQANVG